MSNLVGWPDPLNNELAQRRRDILESKSISDIIGWSFGAVGLIYAWYLNREAKRIKDVARSEAWNLYQSANVSCGKVQDTLKLYKAQHADNPNISVLEELSKADALSLETYRSTIRHIQMVEPVIDIKRINYWVESKKIPEHQWEDFRKIVVDKDLVLPNSASK